MEIYRQILAYKICRCYICTDRRTDRQRERL